jgi:hypothetical protein
MIIFAGKNRIVTTQEKIIRGINNLPDSVTIDVILDQIMLIEKVEKGIEQSDKNQVVSEDDLDKRLGKWLI